MCVKDCNPYSLLFLLGVSLATVVSLVPVSYAEALICEEAPPTRLLVKPITNEIVTDDTKSRAQLKAMSADAYSPYGAAALTHTSGLTKGSIQTTSDIELGIRTNMVSGQSCLWYDAITITLSLENTIYVDRDYQRGSCPYRAVYAHEVKHVNADRTLLNEWSRKIYASLRGFLKPYIQPKAIPAAQLPAYKETMLASLEAYVTVLTEAMQAEREYRQMQVDTLDEYQRVHRQCPEEDWRQSDGF